MSVRLQERFAIVPEWVIYADISAAAVRLYAVLWRHADKERRARPNRRTLAGLSGCSLSTVDRALGELRNIGALAVRPRRSQAEGGRQTSNEFTLNVVRPDINLTLPLVTDEEGGYRTSEEAPLVTDEEPRTRSRSLNENHLNEKTPLLSPSANGGGVARVELKNAIVESSDYDPAFMTKTHWGRVEAAAKEAAAGGFDAGDIVIAARAFRTRYPGADVTPQAIVGAFAMVGKWQSERPRRRR